MKDQVCMAKTRIGRITYYNIFSHVYDGFINMHTGRDTGTTRSFLAGIVREISPEPPDVLDVCCGTGSVLQNFTEEIPVATAVGCDFSRGMLRKAHAKRCRQQCCWAESDATQLPFAGDRFNVVTCSHALYELKGSHRKEALIEMKRVVRPDGVVLIMEHEVPRHPVVRMLFNIRMTAMGSEDAQEFVNAGDKPYRAIFSTVSVAHTPSGKSKVYVCRK
jgi:ubiquinone/menaquinone biosynthesis C-methylase UbiE